MIPRHRRVRIPLVEVYSPANAPALVATARSRGLRVEVLATDTVHYMPVNKTTEEALLIESDELAARVVERMLAAGVRCEQVEVD